MTELSSSFTLPTDFRSIRNKRIVVKFLARPKITYNGIQIGTIGDFQHMRCDRKHLDLLKNHYEIKAVRIDHETR